MLAKNLEGAELGLPIEVVDIDVHPEMAQEYSIRSVPTLVLLGDDGSIQKTSVGVKTVKEIEAWAA
jgi:thioredoxin-like negative regulator of GroEL